MKSQATPGPWEVDENLIVDNDGLRIADVYHMESVKKGATEANARLLAAAPDLLAALRSIRQEAELAQEEWVGVTADYSPKWAWPLKVIAVKADEAIAKAKGE